MGILVATGPPCTPSQAAIPQSQAIQVPHPGAQSSLRLSLIAYMAFLKVKKGNINRLQSFKFSQPQHGDVSECLMIVFDFVTDIRHTDSETN